MGLFSRKQVIVQPVVQGPVFTIPEVPQIPTLPELVDKTKLDVRYPLIAPYVNAHIYWDTQVNELEGLFHRCLAQPLGGRPDTIIHDTQKEPQWRSNA